MGRPLKEPENGSRFAIRLRRARLRAGLTQEEMACLLGLKLAAAVSKLELGQRDPTDTMRLLFDHIDAWLSARPGVRGR